MEPKMMFSGTLLLFVLLFKTTEGNVESLSTVAPTFAPPVAPGSCPLHWFEFNNYCYRVYKGDNAREKKTQPEALSHCHAQGSDLVSYHSMDEMFAVNSHLGGRQEAWIGLFTKGTVEENEWTDGTKLDFTKWGEGQPDNQNGEANCVEHSLYSWNGGDWTHKNCLVRQNWICKMKKGDRPDGVLQAIPVQAP